MTHTEKTSTTCAVILHKSSMYKNCVTYWEYFFWKLILKYFLKKTKLYWQTSRALSTPCKLTYSTYHFFFFCHQKLDSKTWRGYLNLNLTFMKIYKWYPRDVCTCSTICRNFKSTVSVKSIQSFFFFYHKSQIESDYQLSIIIPLQKYSSLKDYLLSYIII